MKRTARIREVWASNLEAEMRNLSLLVDRYDHVAIDTEFPGIVVRLVASQAPDANYQTIRHNVDLLKIIQLGITLSDSNGQSPPEGTTWQFNFTFSLGNDIYAQDSIDLLRSSGIDFATHERDGIDVLTFGELLTSSGLVINPAVKWVAFHGCYDFAYLYKILRAEPLPIHEPDFLKVLKLFFPTMYDLKMLIRHSDNLYGGLNKIADQLGCERFGTTHQAGSDSLLTLDVFMRLRDKVFHGMIDDSNRGILFGFGPNAKPPPAYSPSKIIRTVTASENGSADATTPQPVPPSTLTPS